ncbi:MAG: hypothetical protein NVS3B5_18030 [Sphingomicrobium sp.]
MIRNRRSDPMNTFPADASDNRKTSSPHRRQPRIVLMGMGGTIASSADSVTHWHDYKVTATIDTVLAAVPQVQELADIRCEQICNIDSHEIDNAC